MHALCRRPQGLVFVTGPTGSGKTSTIYGCSREALACENCHGPGKAHVDGGGGKGAGVGPGAMITFAKKDPTPVAKRNEVCLTCHKRGNHVFWEGSAHESRDVACTSCHKIMENVSPKAQLAKATEIEACGTCHLQKRSAIDFVDYDWVAEIIDTVDTIYTALKATIVPKVLDWTASASYAYALGRVDHQNPITPTSSAVANRSTATVKDWPATEDTLIRIDTGLHFAKAWTASLGDAFESFQKNNWHTERVNPFTPGLTSIFMGSDAQNYAAHIVGVALAYRFR